MANWGAGGLLHRLGDGLKLTGFRYYDVATGRFLTRDPIGYVCGVNLYEYLNNDVLEEFDPT